MTVRKHSNLREELIVAGINEINKNGVANFSIRRVAEACHVSCAAPYRHFESKYDFIAAIIDYVNDIWAERQEEILEKCGNSAREQIVEITLMAIVWVRIKYIKSPIEKQFEKLCEIFDGKTDISFDFNVEK